MRDALPLELNWQFLSGSIFDATILGLSLKTDSGRVGYLEKVDLRTSTLPLLIGRIATDINAQSGNSRISGEAILGPVHWRIDAIEGEIDLGEISKMVSGLDYFGINGKLALSGDGLGGSYDSLPTGGNADIRINNLVLAIVNSTRPLGSYQVSIHSNNNEGMKGTIQTLPGRNQLYINGEVTLDGSEKSAAIRAQGWTAADAEKPVEDLLPLLGRVENGKAQINWARNW
jgi:hypothetical protein